ncbi:MAG: hypothetical protein H6525_07170 [Actinobacteria bacterium]|nr:hypothetical protein [Actinomycetota bacterium]
MLLVLGAVVLSVAGLSIAANSALADSESFATRLNEVRKDPTVAAEAGQLATERIVEAKPDLIAVRPLLEGVITWVAGSSALDEPFITTARELHRSLTDADGNALVLRLVDLSAAVTGALDTLAPDLADRIPPDLPVTLSEVGSGTALTPIITAATTIYVLAWVLPLVGAGLLLGAVLVSRDRRRFVLRAGAACLVAAGVLGIVIAAGAGAAWAQPGDTLAGAFVRALWSAFASAFITPGIVLAVIGLFLIAAAGALLPRFDVPRLLRAGWEGIAGSRGRPGMAVLHAVLVIALGLAIIAWPTAALITVTVSAGILIVLAGMAEISRVAADRIVVETDSHPPEPLLSRWLTAGVAGAVTAAVVFGSAALASAPGDDPTDSVAVDAAVPANDPNGPCNGHVELCDRRYDEVAYAAAHNAMSAADLPGWYLPEQPTSLVGALEAGVRVLLFDTWYGQATDRGVVTVPRDRAAAEEQAREQFGDATVDSALRSAASAEAQPGSAVRPYMCHTLCELGATDFEESMAGVAAWLRNNPREVVSFFIQDVVTPADTAAVLERTGLADQAYVAVPGQPFPTLREMIDTGKRLVVLMEEESGGTQYPYLLPGFDWVQETPYTFASAADFSCEPNRGPTDAPLFQLNHWLAGFGSLVSNAAAVNTEEVLGSRAFECAQVRGQLPNFVAVNFYNIGAVFDVVDQLNRVGGDAAQAGDPATPAADSSAPAVP